MQHVGRVDVLQTAERLVDEGLEVRVRERLAGTDLSLSMKERSVRSFVRACVRSIARISGEGQTNNERSTHDGVEVGLHELFVEVHLIEVPIRAKDNVHIIQASDLSPEGTRGA